VDEGSVVSWKHARDRSQGEYRNTKTYKAFLYAIENRKLDVDLTGGSNFGFGTTRNLTALTWNRAVPQIAQHRTMSKSKNCSGIQRPSNESLAIHDRKVHP
jgi:hypothetical protein